MKAVTMVKPLGHRVLLKPDEALKSKGGIVLLDTTREQERNAQAVGTVLAVGDTCWSDTGNGEPWCKVGDRVVYLAHSGKKLWNPATANYREDLLLVNDLDITALVTEEETIDG